LSKITLAQTSYGHFLSSTTAATVRVATPEDPASARFGETFCSCRAAGSLKSSWGLEAHVCVEPAGSWHWSNDAERLGDVGGTTAS
jgi:alkane 1-monooxygenase